MKDPYTDQISSAPNLVLRAASGEVNDDRPLVRFLYLLGRDHMTQGQLEEILQAMEANGCCGEHRSMTMFTNGWLAKWAQHSADRLGVPS